ncbi:MAG: type II toxin-antitoxin system PemK/MazF family toxin [Angustibacter sp.]
MTWSEILRRTGRALLRSAVREATRPTGRRARPPRASGRPRTPGTGYAGDFTGTWTAVYAPSPNGTADPGEVVWAWVPFEEDHSQGKDRPVLVVAVKAPYLLALMLTSKDHDVDAADEARHGRVWMDIGTGAWDRQRRPSEVRLDRVLQLDPSAVRREGARLDRDRFDQVAAALRRHQGWR